MFWLEKYCLFKKNVINNKYLVDNGANIQAKTKDGKTPLELADIAANQSSDKENLAKIIRFLEDKEAEKWQDWKKPF